MMTSNIWDASTNDDAVPIECIWWNYDQMVARDGWRVHCSALRL